MKKFFAYTSLLLAGFIVLFTFLVMKPTRKTVVPSVSSVEFDVETEALLYEYFSPSEQIVCMYNADVTGTLYESGSLKEAFAKLKVVAHSFYTKPQSIGEDTVAYKQLQRNSSNDGYDMKEVHTTENLSIPIQICFDPAAFLGAHIPVDIQVYNVFYFFEQNLIQIQHHFIYVNTNYGDYVFRVIQSGDSDGRKTSHIFLYRAEDFYELCKDTEGPHEPPYDSSVIKTKAWNLLRPNYNIEDPSFNLFTQTPNQRRLWTVLYCAVSYLTISVSAWIGVSVYDRKRSAKKAAPKAVETN